MSESTQVCFDEEERLNLLASMQSLERTAKSIRERMPTDMATWPEDVDDEYRDVMQTWEWIKVELLEDEGPFKHVGQEFLAERTTQVELDDED